MTLEKIAEYSARYMRIVIPTVASQIVFLVIETTCLLYVGNANDSALTAGVGISLIYVNCTCVSILRGMNNTIQILVSISYGQKDYKRCEDVMQRGRLISLIAFLPLIFVAL